jgi:hypothetical protein
MGDKKIVSYKTICPFCKREHKQHLYINTICGCGAKFYYRDFIWLNRQTGEKIHAIFDVSFVSEEENERA